MQVLKTTSLYAIVDIETTGGNAAGNGITEVAIIIHDGKKVVRTYESLVNPGCQIPRFITSLTGISNAMVASAPSFAEIADTVWNMLKDCVFIAHNVNFDYSFLKYHLKQCDLELNTKKLCTVRLSRKLLTDLPSYSLGRLCQSLGIEIEGRHRAGGDARATVRLFELLLEEGAEAHIDQMLKRNSSEQWLPLHLDKEQITRLPAKPGVYYFHDQKGKVIYVGKAINIRKRVTSHFTGSDEGNRRQQFLRKVHNITHAVCCNELHALVLESTEIKRLWPPYNYSQKQRVQKFALYSFEDNKGFIRLAINKKMKNLPALYQFNQLHEGRVMLKKLAEEFDLEPSLCFLHPGESCSINFEPHQYNEKVSKAITALNEKLPTFAIVDEPIENKTLCLLVEKGSFWGMGYLKNEEAPVLEELKEKLQPFPDSDFIRTSIYNYAAANPARVRNL